MSILADRELPPTLKVVSDIEPPLTAEHESVIDSLVAFPLWREWSKSSYCPLSPVEIDVIDVITDNIGLELIALNLDISVGKLKNVIRSAVQKLKFAQPKYQQWMFFRAIQQSSMWLELPYEQKILMLPYLDLNPPVQVRKIFERLECANLEELFVFSIDEMQRTVGVGKRSVAALRKFLEEIGANRLLREE